MKRNVGKFRKAVLIGVISFVSLFSIGVSYAWYTGMDDISATKEGVEVMTPYFLYLLNPGTSDSLQYTIGNIHPAETKQTVICVSNKKPDDIIDDTVDIARVSDFTYELEFITTSNLEVIYELFELEMHELAAGERHESIFGTSEVTDVVNRGSYTLYSKDSNGDDLHLVYSEDEYDYNYYLIEVNWKDETSFEKSLKETDVNYVVVNAKQPKPVEDDTTQNTQVLQETQESQGNQEVQESSELTGNE